MDNKDNIRNIDRISYTNAVKALENLTDWVNPPTVDDLKADYDEATPYHSEHVAEVDKALRALEGKLKREPLPGRSRIQPKVIRKQNEWQYADLKEPFLSTDDMFKVHPVTANDVEAARQNELIINKQFRIDIPKVKFIDKYVDTAVDTGSVVMKTSWYVEYGTVREEIIAYEYPSPEQLLEMFQQQLQEQFAQIEQAVQEGQISPEDAYAQMQEMQNQTQQQLEQIISIMQQAQEQLYPIIERGGNEAKEAYAAFDQIMAEIGVEPISEYPVTLMIDKEVKNCPVVEVLDSRNVIIDPSCEGDINKAQFVIHKYQTDMSSLKKDGRYKNLDMVNTSSETTDIEGRVPLMKFKDKPRKKLTVYEYWGYWDIDGTGIVKPFVATYIDDIMIRLEENQYPDKKLPFVMVQYLHVTNELYGRAAASLIDDNQAIIGSIMRGTLDIMARAANGQRGIAKGALDTNEEIKFNRGEDYKFNQLQGGIQHMFHMHTFPEIPRSALEILTMQANEVESMSGVKAFGQGITSQAIGDSVGGIQTALSATAKRQLGILRRLAEGLKEVGRKILAMNSVFLSDEEIIRTTMNEFVAIKRDDLAGNFDLILDVSTAEADKYKMDRLSFLLQTVGNSVDWNITKIIFGKIANLMKLPDLEQMILSYEPQPDPIAQERAVLENELIKTEIAYNNARAVSGEMDVPLKDARAQAQMAQARKLGSDADLKDLEFTETASGLTQDRELEKLIANKAEPTPSTKK